MTLYRPVSVAGTFCGGADTAAAAGAAAAPAMEAPPPRSQYNPTSFRRVPAPMGAQTMGKQLAQRAHMF